VREREAVLGQALTLAGVEPHGARQGAVAVCGRDARDEAVAVCGRDARDDRA
jgi:hypothetical protein